MLWIAPTEKDSGTKTLEERLWASADQFRANSGLKPQEYSGPILGIIFLRFPSAQLLKMFGDATIPMAEQIHTLHRKIQNLRRTRDLLLPRLVSGQVTLNEN